MVSLLLFYFSYTNVSLFMIQYVILFDYDNRRYLLIAKYNVKFVLYALIFGTYGILQT